jgi:outer membrane protein
MSVERIGMAGWVALVFCLAVKPALAESALHLATPWEDPLLSRPPELDHGKILPGDRSTYACSPSQPAAGMVLPLAQAVDWALCHNPQVQMAWANIKIQAAQVGEARAAYLPTLSAGVNQSSTHAEYAENAFQVDRRQSNRSHYYTLTWRLLDAGARSAKRRAADALLDAASASHDAAIQRLLTSVISLYFEAQTASANLVARQRGESLARETLAVARRREARGLGAKTDTLQAQTSLAKAELERARAMGQYKKALTALMVVIGLQAQDVPGMALAADVDDEQSTLEQDLADWLEAASQQHPAILAARSRLEAARNKLEATRADGLPTVDLSASRYFNGRPNQAGTLTQGRETVVGVSLNIPLFDGFSHTYKVRGAQGQIELKEAELRETQSQILGDIAVAHAEATAALASLASSQALLDAARHALENVQRRYDRGIADIVEMLNVQAALADAEQERVRSLADWRSARLRLLASAGTLGRSAIAPLRQP